VDAVLLVLALPVGWLGVLLLRFRSMAVSTFAALAGVAAVVWLCARWWEIAVAVATVSFVASEVYFIRRVVHWNR
jgi:hypothetical protein